MMPDEIPIWERFLDKFPGRFERVEYDVRVGTAISVPEEIPENIKKDAQVLSLKRIDAIGWKMGKPTVLEVKRILAFTALGQAIGYPIMFAQQRQSPELPGIILIGEKIDNDMKSVLELVEIPYEIV